MDLLIWVHLDKVGPSFERKLDEQLRYSGRHRNLPRWRKAFKAEWHRCEKSPISDPNGNPKYNPLPYRWVCSCPYFSTSRFLICKHLVQAVHPVSPKFFIEVTRNRTGATWVHPLLQPLHSPYPGDAQPNPLTTVSCPISSLIEPLEESDDDGFDDSNRLVSIDLFEQEMHKFQRVLLELSDILEYNAPLTDLRTLPVLRRHLAAVSDLHTRLLEKEKNTNSVTGLPPRTWDTQFGDIMFFRTRPPKRIDEFSRKNAL